MLLVQEFLKNHSLKELQDQYGVYCNFDKTGHFASFNYDQIESKESDELSQQCRGLILARLDGSIYNQDLNIVAGDTKILACPFFRFFNDGQGSAAKINWNDPSLKVLSKEDGTCIIVWFNPFSNDWSIATRGKPEADVPLNSDNSSLTFSLLFKKVIKDQYNIEFNEFTKSLNKDITYIFELCSLYNRIVVNYNTPKIFLLGARNINTLQEISLNKIEITTEIPRVHAYVLTNINDIVDYVSSCNPLEHEGVVVLDSNFNRIKVKNANYVAFSKLRDTLGTSERNCLELILNEREDDCISALPQEIVDNLLKIKSAFIKLIKDYDIKYLEILNKANSIYPGDKKTFAITLQSYQDIWQAPMFNMYGGKSSNIKDFILKSKKEGTFSNSFLDKILDICKKYD